MLLTVAEVIERLKENYEQDETLAITWWSALDVVDYVEDLESFKGDAEELWDMVAYDVDNALENSIGEVNDAMVYAIDVVEAQAEAEEDEE